MTTAPPAVTIVVPARDAEATIGLLLDGLESQTVERERFELIVVDDGSQDRTPELVRERGWPRLAEGERRGRVASRNRGIELAAAELVAFIDADVVPDPGWVEAGLERFQADPGLGILAGSVVISLPDRPSIAAMLDTATYLTQEGNVRRGGFAVTASMWVRRRLLAEVGGFNEDLGAAHEDKELCWLLTSRGARIEFAAEMRATHPPRETFAAVARKAYRMGRAHAALRRFGRVPAQRPMFATPGMYVPRVSIRKVGRLRDRGVEVSPLTRFALLVSEIVVIVIPRAAGDVVGTIRILGTGR